MIDESDTIVSKYVKCNHCEAVHKVYDVCKSEICIGKEDSMAVLQKKDIQMMIPTDIYDIMEAYNCDIPDFEHALFILQNKKYEEKVLLTKEVLEEEVIGKVLTFNSEGKAILHSRERSLNDPTYVPKIQKILFENGRKVVPPHQVGVIRNRSGERLPFVVEKQIGNGVNSKEHCENYKTRDFKTILEKGLELLLTVKEIRELDLIHNDIKPGNNFVDKNKDFWLGDFDLLINIKDAEKRYEVRKTYSGTPGYISLRADGSQNFQYQDLMSTGASMYYFFTGKKAFKGNNERDQMYNTMGGKYRKLNSFDWISFNKKIVNETSKFLDRLLTPNQSMHFSSPDEAIDSLKNIIDSYK